MRSIAVTQYWQRWESLNNGQLPCQPSHLEMVVAELPFQVVNGENAGAADHLAIDVKQCCQGLTMRRRRHSALAHEPRKKSLDCNSIRLCRVRDAEEAYKGSYPIDIFL
jgi:hypothetical protein